MTYDLTRLTALGKRHRKLRDDLDAIRPDLADEIRAADAAGITKEDIAEISGYKRDQVRQICLPPERRRSRKKSAE